MSACSARVFFCHEEECFQSILHYITETCQSASNDEEEEMTEGLQFQMCEIGSRWAIIRLTVCQSLRIAMGLLIWF